MTEGVKFGNNDRSIHILQTALPSKLSFWKAQIYQSICQLEKTFDLIYTCARCLHLFYISIVHWFVMLVLFTNSFI